MKIGIISQGGKSSNMVADACKRYFSEVDSLSLKNFKIFISDEGVKVKYLGQDLKEYDCLYIRGSYKYAMLQRAITTALNKKVYMPIEPNAFTVAHDKFLTLLTLQKSGVPIPKTYYAHTAKTATKVLEEVSYPVIMKLPEGTHGKGVMIADSIKSAKTILDTLSTFEKPFIIQEFVQTEETSDIRALVAGNKVLAAYRRVAAEGDIRANVHLGGTRKKHKLSKSEKSLALRSAKALGADICGVDIFHCKTPSIIEVNLSPGIYALKDFVSETIIDDIAEFLFIKTSKFKQKKNKAMAEKLDKKAKKNGKKEKAKEKKLLLI